MPYIRDTPSPRSGHSLDYDGFGTKHLARKLNENGQVLEDFEYPALSFPGYNEKPLSQQLEPIAIVGMGCRLPGDVSSPAQFWELMMSKGTGRTPKVPKSRFNIDAHFHPNQERPGSFNVLGGYFLDSDLKEFDPAIFNISPIEAMWMDPQQRKLLEVVYEAFESGGVTLETVNGSTTACFIGSFTSDFQQMSFKEPDFRHSYAATGVDPGLISNRISHVFNMHGPSVTVNTACSSSVYALHNACNALRNKECSAAVVGGTNLVLTVDQHMNTAKLGVLSPTSTCRTFDESADGYGRADAVGAIYLKRLSDAVRDGDPIRAVIRSSAVNSNGKAPAVGITHPNLDGQRDVIQMAYQRCGLDPRLTGYFECHGTGTPVGDPLEVNAVRQAMNQQRTPDDDALWIGAVKTNIGHSEAASGTSAVIKAVLQLEAGVLAPTRGVTKPNPKIKWDDWKVKVVTEPVPFPEHLPVKRVSVNSFGYGGTNAHVILESVDSFIAEYDGIGRRQGKPRGAHHTRRPFLFPFSAHDKTTLKRNIRAYGQVADQYDLLDFSYTLANRRSKFQSRGYVVASSATLTEAFAGDAEAFAFAEKKKTPTIGFAFTGQGAQWARMGYELMTYYPSFLKTIRQLDRALGDLSNGPEWSLEDVLVEEAATSRVNEAEFSQPLCTAIQVAVVTLLAEWGVEPVVTVGHSSGEIAAAFAAGLISATEAIIVAYYRGKVVRNVNTDGGMMAVGLGAEGVANYLKGFEGKVVIACHNSPASVTISGDADALEKIKVQLDAEGIFARAVKTGGKAYHSHHMKAVSAQYEKLVQEAKAATPFDLPKSSNARMVSSVTQEILDSDAVVDEHYWSANLISPVCFNQAVQKIANSSEFSKVDLLIEVGPHSALSGPIKQICKEFGFDKINYIPTLLRGTNSAAQMLKVAGELFLRDYPLDMDRITRIEEPLPSGKIALTRGRVLVDLPTFQWNYAKTLWAEPRQSAEHRAPQYPRHDVLGSRMPGGSKIEPTWRNVLRIRDLPWLNDHSLGGEAVFPAAAYFGMAMEAISQVTETSNEPVSIDNYLLRDISIKNALVTPDNDDGIEVLFNMRPSIYSETESKWWDFNVSSISENGRVNEHMTGTIGINKRQRGEKPVPVPNFPQRASGKSWNQALRNVGFDYGETFGDMDQIRSDGKRFAASSKNIVKQSCGVVEGGESRYVLHPGTVDANLQLIIVSIYAGKLNDMTCGAVPIQVDEVSIWPPTEQQLQTQTANAYSWTDQRGIRSFVSSSQLVADDGELLMDISDMRTVAYEAAVPQRASAPAELQPFGEMSWKLDIDSLSSTHQPSNLSIEEIIGLVAHKNPQAKVLELGTDHAVSSLTKSKLLNYTVVVPEDEIKTTEAAMSDFKHVKVVKYEDVAAGTYDLVIALDSSARSVHHLLAVGGRAILSQDTETSLADLQKAGYTGVDFTTETISGKVLITSTLPEKHMNGHAGKSDNKLTLIYWNEPSTLVTEMEGVFAQSGWVVHTSRLSEHEAQQGESVILVEDTDCPLLATLEEGELESLKSLVNHVASIFWLTPGGILAGKNPMFAMAQGLARSITSEQASLDMTTLDYDPDDTSSKDLVDIVVSLLERQLSKATTCESEYCVSKGLTYISRLAPKNSLNKAYAFDGSVAQSKPFKPEEPLIAKIQAGKVVFQNDDEATKAPAAGQVEVQVQYSGLNKESALVISGSDYPQTFSHELAGTIKRIGDGVKGLTVGDRVVGFNLDRFGVFQKVQADLVEKIQDQESMEEIASLPMAYAAAIYGLEVLARVNAGENLLVLNGTGMAGLAAIRLAQVIGATTLVTVASEEEANFISTTFGLPATQIISPSKTSMSEQINSRTGRHGIDVVFSTSAADTGVSREAWRNIAPFGRFVDVGRKNVLKRSALDSIPIHQSANYLSFDVLDLIKSRPAHVAGVLKRILALYRDGSITGFKSTTVSHLADINEAVSKFSDHFATPKTVLSYSSTEKSIEVLPSRPQIAFHPDATYLLVGALGGLGRSLTAWMTEKGARRFAFLSRSGTDSMQAKTLVDDLEKRGISCQVIRGDATVKADVERAVKSIPVEHPVRGVVQAAMVLKDGLFHSMPYSNWTTSTRPKVQGTMNLHNALIDTPLDFFVMTSSISGTLGTPGQSNYAAANAFLDALARHRMSKGKPTTSLILPMVLGVGYVAEHPEIEEALKRKAMYGIEEDHLIESFEAALASHTSDSPADHVVIGLDPAKLQEAVNGVDTTDAFWLEDRRFSTTKHAMTASDASADGVAAGQSIIGTVLSAATPAEAVKAVSDDFVEKLSRLLLVDLSEFEPDVKSIASYGLDSMIGAELRNWIFKNYKMDVPFQQLLGPELTITKFATQVCANQGVVYEAGNA